MSKLDYKKATAYHRGQFIPFADANVSIASSPVLYGLSIYTVFSANWNDKSRKLFVFRLEEHYKRLVNSARIMDFDSFAQDCSLVQFKQIMLELLRLNKIEEDTLVRATVFIDELVAGTRIHGLKNSLSAYVYQMGEILPRSGIDVCVSSWIRNPDNSIPSRAKVNGSYVNASLMKNEALLNGYDDAIAIDEHGHVSESTVANIFVVRDGMLITPGQATDILEGITRNTIMTLAKELGIKAIERSIDRSELYICDEVFVCGSSASITPVLSIDKRLVGAGKIGPITKELIATYENVRRGNNSAYSDWCTEVN